MKIAILTLGTRGDVQPYAVLGQALKNRGHEVVLATAKNFEALVRSYDIDFVPIQADFQEVLASEKGKKMMKANPFAIKRNLHTWVYPLILDALSQFYVLAQNSDKVIYHVKTLADCFVEQFSHKMIRASLLPIVETTNEFANPAFGGISVPHFLNELTYKFSYLSMKLLSHPIHEFRKKFNLEKNYQIPQIKNIYALSSVFLPCPKDYPQSSKFMGFWFGNSSQEISADLIDFLQKGTAPLLITFGSMPVKIKFDWQNTLLKLTQNLGIRAIVVRAWGLESTEKLKNQPHIKIIENAPFEKLFPHTQAIVHHGGIGTTAQCLRAGKPFMICPILHPVGDQMFWGKHAHKIGVAVKPVPLSQMTEKDFVENISQLISQKHLYQKAKALKKLLDQEDGIQNTITEIENS